MGWLISGWFRRKLLTEQFGDKVLPEGQQYVPWHGRDGHHPVRTANIFPMRGRHGKYFSRFKVS